MTRPVSFSCLFFTCYIGFLQVTHWAPDPVQDSAVQFTLVWSSQIHSSPVHSSAVKSSPPDRFIPDQSGPVRLITVCSSPVQSSLVYSGLVILSIRTYVKTDGVQVHFCELNVFVVLSNFMTFSEEQTIWHPPGGGGNTGDRVGEVWPNSPLLLLVSLSHAHVMLALWTAVTLLLWLFRAYSKAYSAMRLLAFSVIRFMLWITPSKIWNQNRTHITPSTDLRQAQGMWPEP